MPRLPGKPSRANLRSFAFRIQQEIDLKRGAIFDWLRNGEFIYVQHGPGSQTVVYADPEAQKLYRANLALYRAHAALIEAQAELLK